jgi:hypothetical protein
MTPAGYTSRRCLYDEHRLQILHRLEHLHGESYGRYVRAGHNGDVTVAPPPIPCSSDVQLIGVEIKTVVVLPPLGRRTQIAGVIPRAVDETFSLVCGACGVCGTSGMIDV